MRKLAVRKIIDARKSLRALRVVIIVDLLVASTGLTLYLFLLKSPLLFLDSTLWFMEALMYLTLLLAFYIVSSRTIYGARYELFRAESLGVLLTSIITGAILTYIAINSTINYLKGLARITPMYMAYYFVCEIMVNIGLITYITRSIRRSKFKFVILENVKSRLLLDIIAEVSSSTGIILSNLTRIIYFELGLLLALTTYALYSISSNAYSATQYLLGIGPKELIVKTKKDVLELLKLYWSLRPRRIFIRTFGTFSEVELWIEVPPNIRLGKAYRLAVFIAKQLVRSIPHIVRALVIVVPSRRTYVRLKSYGVEKRYEISSEEVCTVATTAINTN